MQISIIMPCYNGEAYLREAINSVLEQTYDNYTLVVVDDGSTDNSREIVREYSSKDSRVTLITNKFEKGAAGARNTGLKRALSSDYIAFLDSDDIWDKNKLELQLQFMLENEVQFSYTSYNVINSDGEIIGSFEPKSTFSRKRLYYTCDIGCSTVMIKTELIRLFSFPYVAKEDYALWLILSEVLESSTRPLCMKLVSYRVTTKSVSANKFLELFRQNNALEKFSNLNMFQRITCLILYSINGVKKHFVKYRNNK
ncbi:glycosyltransferase family 2 protein [Catenovulum sp. 2E275]|uniref:glycosyltransferase family 2 protein n=1 Tax=Catenovulum sp. 2E275 TaxID=2980497 RepID=UPI0021D2FEE4|nr:glycosyltransferase family 2 protein [Catenovulum sp. 2E275]MCU4677337.1 glycosyltransferase family 2 protein [Catenovulum sp. 2E275]